MLADKSWILNQTLKKQTDKTKPKPLKSNTLVTQKKGRKHGLILYLNILFFLFL